MRPTFMHNPYSTRNTLNRRLKCSNDSVNNKLTNDTTAKFDRVLHRDNGIEIKVELTA